MEKMVAGFLFSYDKKYVMLVQKKKPEWQKGKFNAIGGHVNDRETPEKAMQRTFEKEAGIETLLINWEHDVTLTSNSWHVDFYHTFSDAPFEGKRHSALLLHSESRKESIYLCEVNEVVTLSDMIVSNLQWLIPICLDKTLIKPINITSL
jgi:8-oxo-dGTP diphosphatase